MSRLVENSVSRAALLEMQNFVMSLVCPDIPLLHEVEEGTPITMEHVAMLIQAIKGMGGKDLERDISTLMEMVFFP
ncbi:hypothetical protein HMPREF3130_10915 [Corynebacterium sp. HMSC14B06]|uniref:hypothetical protein n=1 Tax=Corynebacterium sp. HMSC14B06 TaxID=1581098 RepID=UPI0008A35180|nr:hypothetical protein [Corynebacterium sp. HMSC14B06]OFT68493.1 hypothetical protein HMPREF3130_10915 [Corynebacterium sp. HMSC14B06]